jgi:hypothetical protein
MLADLRRWHLRQMAQSLSLWLAWEEVKAYTEALTLDRTGLRRWQRLVQRGNQWHPPQMAQSLLPWQNLISSTLGRDWCCCWGDGRWLL